MPTPPTNPPQPRQKVTRLATMIDTGDYLSIRCTHCGRERVVSAYEAVHKWGHDTTIPEVRALIQNRCRSADCRASIGLALQHEIPTTAKTKPP